MDERSSLALGATLALASITIAPAAHAAFDAQRVAVAVYGQGPMGDRLARSAHTRIEQVLSDNGVEVLDEAEGGGADLQRDRVVGDERVAELREGLQSGCGQASSPGTTR